MWRRLEHELPEYSELSRVYSRLTDCQVSCSSCSVGKITLNLSSQAWGGGGRTRWVPDTNYKCRACTLPKYLLSNAIFFSPSPLRPNSVTYLGGEKRGFIFFSLVVTRPEARLSQGTVSRGFRSMTGRDTIRGKKYLSFWSFFQRWFLLSTTWKGSDGPQNDQSAEELDIGSQEDLEVVADPARGPLSTSGGQDSPWPSAGPWLSSGGSEFSLSNTAWVSQCVLKSTELTQCSHVHSGQCGCGSRAMA